MTRETKIGLLVGLAFIIVVGILLSDHVQSSTEPPQAKLADAGKTVQQGVNTLGSNTPAPVSVATPQTITPQQTVPTVNDLNPRPQAPTQVVTIGPGTSQAQQPPVTIVQDQRKETPAATEAQTDTPPTQVASAEHRTSRQTAGADAPDVAPTPVGGIREVARQAGEDLVPVGPAGAIASGKSYKAEAGDTVSKMAVKFFGANTKSNRDAIVKANTSLHDNPDKVIVGKTYIIPGEASAPASPAIASTTPPAAKPAAASSGETPMASSGVESWYTVRQGDSLWKIASEQVGNAGAVAAIKDLNKDVLKGGDVVKVDMKLRLPSRSIASAN